MNENKIKHLEFLQNIITRMNTNSFQIKTFTVTIVSALLAIFASIHNEMFLLISIFVLIVFWLLDSYYLQQERKFREIYNNVSGLKNQIQVKDFEMPIQKVVGGQFNYWNVFFSKTILLFYACMLLLIISISFILFLSSKCD